VRSLAGATLGEIESASLAIGMIGQGLALARGRLTKHAVKQVDRMLSNRGIDVDALLVHWVPYVVGNRDRIVVAMDWTEFDADDQVFGLLDRLDGAEPTLLDLGDQLIERLQGARHAQSDQVMADPLDRRLRQCLGPHAGGPSAARRWATAS